jgi:F-type H+-transporting ATPase subunit delta
MINNQLIIAKRYARAFLNVYSMTDFELKKLQEAIDFLTQHPEIGVFLKIPLLAPEIKRDALKQSIVEKFDLPKSFELIIEVLVRKKRSELLLLVLEQIRNSYQEQRNIQLFTIASSSALTDEQKKILEQYLVNATGATITTNFEVDKKLIAGIRMSSDELQWEYSIAQQLKKIRASLIG